MRHDVIYDYKYSLKFCDIITTMTSKLWYQSSKISTLISHCDIIVGIISLICKYDLFHKLRLWHHKTVKKKLKLCMTLWHHRLQPWNSFVILWYWAIWCDSMFGENDYMSLNCDRSLWNHIEMFWTHSWNHSKIHHIIAEFHSSVCPVMLSSSSGCSTATTQLKPYTQDRLV